MTYIELKDPRRNVGVFLCCNLLCTPITFSLFLIGTCQIELTWRLARWSAR